MRWYITTAHNVYMPMLYAHAICPPTKGSLYLLLLLSQLSSLFIQLTFIHVSASKNYLERTFQTYILGYPFSKQLYFLVCISNCDISTREHRLYHICSVLQ